MAAYELTIERRQPTCGGRAPTSCEVRNIVTDDPMAYVRSQEIGSEPKLMQDEDGIILIQVDRNGLWVRYEFTEE